MNYLLSGLSLLLLINPSHLVSALKIANNLATIEYTPVLIANQDYYKSAASIVSLCISRLTSSIPESLMALLGII